MSSLFTHYTKHKAANLRVQLSLHFPTRVIHTDPEVSKHVPNLITTNYNGGKTLTAWTSIYRVFILCLGIIQYHDNKQTNKPKQSPQLRKHLAHYCKWHCLALQRLTSQWWFRTFSVLIIWIQFFVLLFCSLQCQWCHRSNYSYFDAIEQFLTC